MAAGPLSFLMCIVIIFGVTTSQSLNRGRNLVPYNPVDPSCQYCAPPPTPSPGPLYTADDVSSLFLLAKMLESQQNACNPSGCSSNSCNCNSCSKPNNDCGLDVEGIINKLINALVYTTTQGVQSSSGSSNSNGALISAGLLGQGGNLVQLGLGGKEILDLGLGEGRKSTSTKTSTTSTTTASGSSNEALISADLLGQDGKLVQLDLGRTKVLEVGLGQG